MTGLLLVAFSRPSAWLSFGGGVVLFQLRRRSAEFNASGVLVVENITRGLYGDTAVGRPLSPKGTGIQVERDTLSFPPFVARRETASFYFWF